VPVNLNELVDDWIAGASQAGESKHPAGPPVAAGFAVVLGDATQLEQVFLNLILNATEAMPDGGTLTIKSAPFICRAATRTQRTWPWNSRIPAAA